MGPATGPNITPTEVFPCRAAGGVVDTHDEADWREESS